MQATTEPTMTVAPTVIATTSATAAPAAALALAPGAGTPAGWDSTITQNNQKLLEEGRRVFRFDTFGDEAFWGDTLKLHQAIAGQKNGGVGNGVSPWHRTPARRISQ